MIMSKVSKASEYSSGTLPLLVPKRYQSQLNLLPLRKMREILVEASYRAFDDYPVTDATMN
jgi:hypothetical protein